MAKRRRGKTVSKNRAVSNAAKTTEYEKVPHSFVIHRGRVGKGVLALTKQFRDIMRPYTATDIKVSSKNAMKDFFGVAGPCGVNHICTFSATTKSVYVKVARFPRGPTLTFRVNRYTLCKDVINNRKPTSATRTSSVGLVDNTKLFMNPAVLIMNNVNGDVKIENLEDHDDEEVTERKTNPLTDREFSLISEVIRNMFPSINVTSVGLKDLRRCVMLNFENGAFQLRHYGVRVVPTGLSRSVKKLVSKKALPNMCKFTNMSEYVSTLNEGIATESEGELTSDGNESEAGNEDEEGSSAEKRPRLTTKVVLAHDVGSRGGNLASEKSCIRLVEIGPRIDMELLKIEDGLHEGSVLYHQLVSKTPDEVAQLHAKRKSREKEKERRRKEQAANITSKMEKLKKKTRFGDEVKKEVTTNKQDFKKNSVIDNDSDGGVERESSIQRNFSKRVSATNDDEMKNSSRRRIRTPSKNNVFNTKKKIKTNVKSFRRK